MCVRRTLYVEVYDEDVRSTLYVVQFTMYIVRRTVYSVQYTDVHFTVYILNSPHLRTIIGQYLRQRSGGKGQRTPRPGTAA